MASDDGVDDDDIDDEEDDGDGDFPTSSSSVLSCLACCCLPPVSLTFEMASDGNNWKYLHLLLASKISKVGSTWSDINWK